LFGRLSRWLDQGCPAEGAVVFWDRCERADDDLRRWWTQHVERPTSRLHWIVAGRPGSWSAALPSSGPQEELAPLSWSDVEGWVKHHLRETNAPPSQLARVQQAFVRC